MADGFDAAAINAISIDQLRAGGSFKWSAWPDSIGAFVAEMDLGIAPVITRALHEAVARGAHGYLPDALARELAQACTDWQQQRYGWTIEPGAVQAIPDVLCALEIVLRYVVPAGCTVVLPTPNYMPFAPLLAQLGHRVLTVPMQAPADGGGFDFPALERAFASGAALAILCNPHNPTGRVYRREELATFAQLAQRHGLRVFADEIHAPLVYAGQRHVPYACVSEQAAQQAITATSASKAWNLPGLKCAQLILTSAGDRARWREIGWLAGHGTASLGVVASIAAYRQGDAWLEGALAYLDGNRALIEEILCRQVPALGYHAPEATYLAWLDCRGLNLPLPPRRFFQQRAGIALTDGSDCGPGGEGHVRLNFALPRPILRQALAQMAQALQAL